MTYLQIILTRGIQYLLIEKSILISYYRIIEIITYKPSQMERSTLFIVLSNQSCKEVSYPKLEL